MPVKVEAIAVDALRRHLLRNLPAKVVTVNADRAASVRASYQGPYNIPSGAVLKVGTTVGAEVSVNLTAGAARTAAQLAADVAAASVPGVTASDDDAHFLLTANATPAQGAPSVLSIGADTTGANAALGLSPGGVKCIRSALVAPDNRNVADGWPLSHDFSPSAFVVIIDDRQSEGSENIKEDSYWVSLELAILAAEPNMQASRTREHIQSALRCVREVILADRQLNMQVENTIESSATVKGRPFDPETLWPGSPLMDGARLQLRCRVYERNP